MMSGVKRVIKVLLTIVTVIVVILVCTTVLNVVLTNMEKSRIQDYGEKITVDNQTMNVYLQGEAEDTVVLLTGYGTTAPALDFQPLIRELSHDYRVVVVEPFGYGLSDVTDRPRSMQNIADEVHQCLQALEIERYVLMMHSISGVYGLEYVNRYGDEVIAWVGIDSSVPQQIDDMDSPDSGLSYRFLHKSGLLRLMAAVNPAMIETDGLDEQANEQVRMLFHRNFMNQSILNEGASVSASFHEAKSLRIPQDMPTLIFLASETVSDTDGWADMHEALIADVNHARIVTLDGEHYLHHTQSKEMARCLNEFLNG